MFYQMGLEVKNPKLVACKQQWGRPDCASAQSDQHPFYSLSVKYSIQTYSIQNFNIQTSLYLRRLDFVSGSPKPRRQVFSQPGPNKDSLETLVLLYTKIAEFDHHAFMISQVL